MFAVRATKDSNFTIRFQIVDALPPVDSSNIQWHFTNLNGTRTEIRSSSHYTLSSDIRELHIHSVQLADRGSYSLTASNEAGNGTAAIQMDVYS